MRQSDQPEITYLPTTGVEAHLGAIAYLAVLAYPGPNEWGKRDRFMEHMKGWLVKRYWGPPGSLGRSERRKKLTPKYTGMDNRHIEQVLQHGFERIRRRLWAAQIATRKVIDGLSIGPFRFRTRHSVRGLWRDFQKFDKSVVWTEEDFRKRVWEPSLPVLHLAAFFPRFANEYRDPIELVRNADWLDATLQCADAWRPAIAEKIQGFDPEKAIRLLSRSL